MGLRRYPGESQVRWAVLATLAVLVTPAMAQEQPWRIDPDGQGYRVLYPDGNFTRVMPCGNSLCIQSTDPALPTPPILPIDPFVGSRTDPNGDFDAPY